MDIFLQLWGGIGYLLNKIFLWFSERAKRKGGGDLNSPSSQISRRWRIASWSVYLLSLPPWIVILASWRNWIVASVEASGAPAMFLGLIIAIRGTGKKTPRWLNRIALACIPLGFGYSLYDFGGVNTINQWLEIGLVLGFLVGTYMLAKERPNGYLWYILMHVTCAWLMWIQGYPWLLLQQLLSLFFIVDAYRLAIQKKHKVANEVKLM